MFWKRRNKLKNETWYRKALKVQYDFSEMEDSAVVEMLKRCIGFGIRKIDTSESHYMTILFKNDIEYKFWDSNKYYAWMCQGSFTDVQKSKVLYHYSAGRPSAELMWITKQMIAQYFGELLSENDNITIFNALQSHESIKVG